MTLITLGAIMAPFFVVSPYVWQPGAILALIPSAWAIMLASRPQIDRAVLLSGGALSLIVLTLPPAAGYSRPGGYFDNPNLAGAALGGLLVYAAGLQAWGWAGLMALGLVKSGSVGAILGALAALGYLGAVSGPVRAFIAQHKRLIILGGILGALGALGALLLVAQARPYWGDRLGLWRVAWGMIRVNPLQGAGGGAFHRTTFITGWDPYWSRVKPLLQPHAHNLYLHIWAEYGLASLGAILGGLGLLWTAQTPPGRAILAGLMVHSLVDCTALFLPVALTLGLLLILCSQGSNNLIKYGL